MDGVTDSRKADVFTGYVLVHVADGRAYHSGYVEEKRAREMAEKISNGGAGEIVVNAVVFER